MPFLKHLHLFSCCTSIIFGDFMLRKYFLKHWSNMIGAVQRKITLYQKAHKQTFCSGNFIFVQKNFFFFSFTKCLLSHYWYAFSLSDVDHIISTTMINTNVCHKKHTKCIIYTLSWLLNERKFAAIICFEGLQIFFLLSDIILVKNVYINPS